MNPLTKLAEANKEIERLRTKGISFMDFAIDLLNWIEHVDPEAYNNFDEKFNQLKEAMEDG